MMNMFGRLVSMGQRCELDKLNRSGPALRTGAWQNMRVLPAGRHETSGDRHTFSAQGFDLEDAGEKLTKTK